MAITVDVQPAYATSSTLVATTASFTPTAGSLLVVLVGIGNGLGTAGSGSSVITDTGSHSWTLLKRENPSASSTTAEVWVADNASTSAITVTATSQVANQLSVGLQAISFLGAAPKVSQTGATAIATASTVSVTTTQTGSQVVGAFGYFTAITLVANANSTILGQFHTSTSGDTEAAFKATSLTGTPGATSVGFTNTTNANMSIAAVEILAASSGSVSSNTFSGALTPRAQFSPGINGGMLEQIQPNFWQQNRPSPVVAPDLVTQHLRLMVPAYVAAGDSELTDLVNASPAVGGVIVDVNNGDTAIGSPLLAQVDALRTLGIKVFWYIYAPYTPSLRSLGAIQTALNNGLVTGDKIIHFDGVFIDEYARDVGSSSGLTDYITYYTTIRSMIRDTANGVVPQSGGTVLAMANPGTAIDDRYVSQNVADIFNTFEGTVQSYNNSWLGGNVFNLGSGLYRLGQDFPSATFCHLVTNVSPTTDPSGMRSTIDIAYARWTGWTYVTDQPISPNPWINSPAWGFSAETSYAASEPYFNGSLSGVWPGTLAPGWPGPELDLLIPNFWMSGSTTLATTILVSDTDSSTGSETQSLVLADTDSVLGSENQSIAITSSDSSLESESQTVGVSSVDSSSGSDSVGTTIAAALSSADTSAGSDALPSIGVISVDSSLETENSSYVVSITTTDTSVETENSSIAVSGSDSSIGTDSSTTLAASVPSVDSSIESDTQVLGIIVSDSSLESEIQNLVLFGTDSILGSDTTLIVALNSSDSSIVSESAVIATASTESSVGAEGATSLQVAIPTTETSAGTENSTISISDIDYSSGTDVSTNVAFSISNSDSSVESDTQSLGIINSDSITGTDSSKLISISSTDSGKEAEDSTISVSSAENCQEAEVQSLGITDYDSFQEGEASSPLVVAISTADNVLLDDYQLGSRMAYKIFVSNFSCDVGIPAIIELTTGLPTLTIAPLGVTAVASADSIATNESSNIVAALSGTESSVGTDVSLGIAIALNGSDSSVMAENSSLFITTTVSSSDSCVATDIVFTLSTNVPTTEVSVASESSALNIISTDAVLGTESGLVGQSRSDSDHSTLTESQAITVALSSADSSVCSDIQNTTILFSSSDSIIGTDSSQPIAEATTDADSGRLAAEQQSFSASLIQTDMSTMTEVVVGMVIHVSDVDSCHIRDDQPFFFFDSDSIGFQETALFSVAQQGSDECTMVSENSFFFLQTSLTMEWAVFPHLDQVVFAQPLNK